MAVQPTTQQTYSESDLAPISELIKTSQKRGFWSKIAGGVSTTVNTIGDATQLATGIPIGRIRTPMGL
jgi:hypothetical protein